MAAGLGFKDFTTGEVLTAADVDGYLMQGIWVFANTTARDAAVTAPSEGNFAFTKDTNSLWYYDGAAWVASGATGDIEGVTAGTGISGGGTSGTVTITNSMATAITTSGDLIQGTGSGTFARLGSGTNGQFLTTNGSTLSWTGAPSSTQNWSLINSPFTSLSGSASVTISGITNADKLLIIISNASSGGAGAYKVKLLINGSTSSYNPGGLIIQAPTSYTQNSMMDQYNAGTLTDSIYLGQFSSSAGSYMGGSCYINGGATSGIKVWESQVGTTPSSANNAQSIVSAGAWTNSATISSITINHNDGATNFDDGYIYVYKSA